MILNLLTKIIKLEIKLKDEDDKLQDLPTGKEKIKNDSDPFIFFEI